MADILEQIPSVEKVVVVPYTDSNPDISGITKAVLFSDFLSPESTLEIEFESGIYFP